MEKPADSRKSHKLTFGSLAVSQIPKEKLSFSYLAKDFTINNLSAKFRNKHYMLFVVPFGMCYYPTIHFWMTSSVLCLRTVGEPSQSYYRGDSEHSYKLSELPA